MILKLEPSQNESKISSKYFSAMVYVNVCIGAFLVILGIPFLMIHTMTGFRFVFLGFCLTFVIYQIYKKDLFYGIILFFVGIFIALLVVLDPITIFYYPVLILTIYVFGFDKEIKTLFKNKFNRDLTYLYIVITLQYLYLIIAGYLSLQIFEDRNPSDMVIYYLLTFICFFNLFHLQHLKYMARVYMLVTTALFLIYSIIEIQNNLLPLIAIGINIITWFVLLFDNRSKKYFKKVDTDNFTQYNIMKGINILAFLLLVLGILYLISTQESLSVIMGGFIMSIFYAIALIKVEIRSKIWKNIFTIFMLSAFVASLLIFELYPIFSIIMIPTSILTLLTLNFDITTINRFNKTNFSI